MLGVRNAERMYAVAFKSAKVANRVGRRLDMYPQLRFKRISDRTARLTIDKNSGNDCAVCDVHNVNFQEFLMYPFDKCLGIVLPFKLLEETRQQYVFLSWIVDPCDEETCGLLKYGVRDATFDSQIKI
jgi:hypothetical protein